ncbi:MAG: hypothetical protein ACYC7A_14865 [Thermoanaerobaculia bacterium]
MLDRLFPRVIDNAYRGPKAALWILGFLAASKITMALNSVANGVYVLTSADGVPLATYPPAAAQTIVALFALWGWSLFLFALFAVIVLVRYRSATALAFAVLLAEHVGRKVIMQFLPIVRSYTAAAWWVNAVLLALMVIGLGLSLWPVRGGETSTR